MNHHTFLILGANGQLGKQFKKELVARRENVIAPEEKDCDITSFDKLARYVEAEAPTVIINCAAYNAVDQAEQQTDTAYLINGKSVEYIAKLCKQFGIFLVHYSSDYVFDGKKGNLYDESEVPNPLNVYGKSKLAGEEAMQKYGGSYLLFRTSWVFGSGTQNFIYKMSQWAQNNPVLKLSCDEVSVPTSTLDLVSLTLLSLEKGLKGLYHLTSSDYASRYEWGRYIVRSISPQTIIIPVPMATFPSAAQRPIFSAMSNASLERDLDIEIHPWQNAVDKFLLEYPDTMKHS
ncbi:MAG: dTDP-4-dehydrorhamnose reductase [Bacteroidota bacterium]